jgi:hypothetical protein
MYVDIFGAVRRDVPSGRGPHRELERALEVRLVEARVDPVDVVRLGVGVAVDGAVHGVDEAVHADPVVLEGGAALDLENVVLLKAGEPDAVAVEGFEPHRTPVELDARHHRGEVLDEALGPRAGAVEDDLGHAAERLGIGVEKIEGYQIRRAGDQPGALRCFVPRQVIQGHALA